MKPHMWCLTRQRSWQSWCAAAAAAARARITAASALAAMLAAAALCCATAQHACLFLQGSWLKESSIISVWSNLTLHGQNPSLLSTLPHLLSQIREASKLVVFTGAGISTAAGIPDFRGPQGVWTLQRKGLPLPKLHTSFVYAQPSLTHQALLGLMQQGKLQYICSQNVDSLHLRSGGWLGG